MTDWLGGFTVGATWVAALWATAVSARARRDRQAVQKMENHMAEMFDQITSETTRSRRDRNAE